jgi:hypothetical protein
MISRRWVADERRQPLWCVCSYCCKFWPYEGPLCSAKCGQDGVCTVLLLCNKIPSDILALYKLLKYINQEMVSAIDGEWYRVTVFRREDNSSGYVKTGNSR